LSVFSRKTGKPIGRLTDVVTGQFVSTIPIPRLKPEKEKEIAEKIRKAESERAEANRIMADEIDLVESIIINAK